MTDTPNNIFKIRSTKKSKTDSTALSYPKKIAIELSSHRHNNKKYSLKDQKWAADNFTLNIQKITKKAEFRIMHASTKKYITLDRNGIATLSALMLEDSNKYLQIFSAIFDEEVGSYKLYNAYFDSELYYYGHHDSHHRFLRVWPPCSEGGQYWNFSIDNQNSGIYFINQDWENHYLSYYNNKFLLWEWKTVDTHWILQIDTLTRSTLTNYY